MPIDFKNKEEIIKRDIMFVLKIQTEKKIKYLARQIIDEENGYRYISIVPTLTEKSSSNEAATRQSNYRKSKKTQKNISDYKNKLNNAAIEIKHLNSEIESTALNELRASVKKR